MAGQGGRRPARRRFDRALHRALPQGSHRRPGRTQLRTLEERLRYLRELEDRRKTILDSIREQGKLTDELALQINAADTKARLEDLYLPYKPKRRTKAQIATEAGLEPLADLLLTEPDPRPEARRGGFRECREGRSPTPEAALEGARSILVERFAENAELLGALRDIYWERGSLTSKVRDGKQNGRRQVLPTISTSPSRCRSCPRTASSRCSAARRRRSSTCAWRRTRTRPSPATSAATRAASRSPSASPIRAVPATSGCSTPCAGPGGRSCASRIELDMKMRLWQLAEDEAVKVFAGNLRDLLLAAPAGARADAGPRSGLPHRREGRGGGCDRQGGGHRHHLPARAASGNGMNRIAHAGAPLPRAQGRADRHRQRHGLARDRQARGRAGRRSIRT